MTHAQSKESSEPLQIDKKIDGAERIDEVEPGVLRSTDGKGDSEHHESITASGGAKSDDEIIDSKKLSPNEEGDGQVAKRYKYDSKAKPAETVDGKSKSFPEF